jgi:hypothetical protein
MPRTGKQEIPFSDVDEEAVAAYIRFGGNKPEFLDKPLAKRSFFKKLGGELQTFV